LHPLRLVGNVIRVIPDHGFGPFVGIIDVQAFRAAVRFFSAMLVSRQIVFGTIIVVSQRRL
jgi:hypothetical protein